MKRVAGHWALRSLYYRVGCLLALLIIKRIVSLLTGRKLVLISLYEHIGDIIACEPVIKYVKQTTRNAHIVWGININYAELLEEHPNVDYLLRFNSFSEWIFLSKILKRWPWITSTIDLHIDERRCAKYGFKLKKVSTTNHHQNFTTKSLLQAFSSNAGLPELNAAPVFYLNKQKQPALPPHPFIVVHTQSNNPVKDWQPAKWDALCLHLGKMGYHVVEVGVNRLVTNGGSVYIDYTGKRSLQEIANLIKSSTYFIGVDSGFAHMANALGNDGLVLIGHYNTGKFTFKNYNPFTGRFASADHILYPEVGSLKEMEVQEVIDKLTANLSKLSGAVTGLQSINI